MATHDKPLSGHIALVTGAAQGIGFAVAQRLAADGANVAINGRSLDHRLQDAAAKLGAFPVAADMSQPDEVAAMVQQVEAELGEVSIAVVNHAYMSMAPFLDYDTEDWWKIIDTNLGGTFSLVQNVLPGMRRLGAGRIIIISSEWGVTGWPNATAYSASKAGLISLTKTLGRELAPERIIVNAIAPGVVDTPQLQVDALDAGLTLDEVKSQYAEDIPLGRVGNPAEIASVAALLAHPRLEAIVGQTIQANGGTTRTRV
jgi:NAD(P)-dependent dehydrogenase (short-subunit alcohol dehydrogenase family)